MPSVLSVPRESTAGYKARKLRISRLMTRRELAERAGVSVAEIDLFERSLPLPLDIRRRLLKELWAKKGRK
jgi:transcriptional regulator with XRE-family HTH domain